MMDGCILLTNPVPGWPGWATVPNCPLVATQSPRAPRAYGYLSSRLTWEARPPVCNPIPWARLCAAHLRQALSLLPLQVTTAAWEASHGEHLAISSGEPLTVTLEDACCSSGLVLGPQAQIRHVILSTTSHLVRNDLWDLADQFPEDLALKWVALLLLSSVT